MTSCGIPGCRCARGQCHGPYVRWGHMVNGKLVQRWLSAEEPPRLAAANRDLRVLNRLLRAWECEHSSSWRTPIAVSLDATTTYED